MIQNGSCFILAQRFLYEKYESEFEEEERQVNEYTTQLEQRKSLVLN